MFENAVDDAEHMAHVGAAIGLGRSTDGNELQPGVLRRFSGIGGEAQAAAGQVLLQQRRKAGLENRAMSLAERRHPRGVDIHA